jgi:hypothetical protein
MTTLNSLKNNLISQIMASKNEKLLKAINNIFDSTKENNIASLNLPHQIEMLMMSERDIENGRLISAEDLEKSDSEWVS